MEIADAVQRALKPGGRWILHVPNGEALFGARMRYWDFLATGAFTGAKEKGARQAELEQQWAAFAKAVDDILGGGS